MLEVLKKKNHPDYQEITEWLGKDFDPDNFNIDQVNELLREEDFGSINLLD